MKILAAKLGVLLSAGIVAGFHEQLHLKEGHVYSLHTLAGIILAYLWHLGITLAKAKLKSASLLVAGVGLVAATEGCSLTPQQIETDTAVAVNLGLQGATIFDASKKPEIQADAVAIAQTINSVVLAQFMPGARAGALLNSAAQQVIPHLQARLAALKHGPEILAVISLLQVPLTSALGGTASPTALMSSTAQMNTLAFFSGVSQGISTFTGNAALMPPPLPAMPVNAPPPVPAPAAPAPGAKQ